jgi:hypothetical protein
MAFPTFADLCAAMAAAGVDVLVGLEDGRHVIRLVDRGGARALEVQVALGFDREVGVLCCSAALCADVPGCAGPGVDVARRWPELAALARAVVDRPPPVG